MNFHIHLSCAIIAGIIHSLIGFTHNLIGCKFLLRAGRLACACLIYLRDGLEGFSMESDDFDPLNPEFPGTRMDEDFDFERPEFLMYASSAQDAVLVGFAWYVRTDSENPPAGFPGGNDWWHVHEVLCFTNSSFQVVGQDISDEQCHSMDGTNVHLDDYWMTHAWIIEPWLTQFDVFTNHHPCLKQDGAESNLEDSCWEEAGGVGGGHDDSGDNS